MPSGKNPREPTSSKTLQEKAANVVASIQ